MTVEEKWDRELGMWEGIIDASLPGFEGGPWATVAERMTRVKHVALVVALTLALAPAERELARQKIAAGSGGR